MLDAETKRRIDSARQILVGVLPNPMQQVEQITTAMIYKFMDDMDERARKLGGVPSFFTGDFEKYSWHKLMDSRLGNQERLNLYFEAITNISKNKDIPALFREIFSKSYLPFNDPRVLGIFLGEIDQFEYKHSEELGNAYEYLLSIMGSQGDAGQFRTPRHIIDFIVEAVDPKKDDRILDPACGTAGFLISAYKHILKNHDGLDNKTGKPTKNEKQLTVDERAKIHKNIIGYDIDPGMVRMALVNMYLHGFKEPDIRVYDTLSKEDYWDEEYDVMLANPPFMTPKGGIQPHQRFGVQAKRAEVLFVDYIVEHLNVNGRAGIIVPEGIIFKSENSYKKLRKILVEDGLYAVVSLPSGVFQPYSGVKTSILLFDKQIRKERDEILFLKIENDGFDLGAQRREINKNDLPKALEILKKWKSGKKQESDLALWVKKEKIAESGDYNLAGDRYQEITDYFNIDYEVVNLGEICDIKTGKKDVNQGSENGKYPFFTCAKEHTFSDEYSFDKEALLIAGNGDVGSVKYFKGKFEAYQRTYVLSEFKNVNARYLYHVLNIKLKETVSKQKLGNTMPYIKLGMLTDFKIPLPPLEIQKQIVEELDGYQKIIDGARQVVENWKPNIKIDPEWEMVKLGEISNLMTGGTPLTSKKDKYYGGDIKWLVSGDINKGEIFDCNGRITELALKESNAKILPINSVLIALNGQGKTRGTVALLRTKAACNQSLVSINPDKDKMIPEFLFYVLKGDYKKIRNINGENQRGGLNMPIIRKFKVPIASLKIQEKIVAEIKAEQKIVDQNKKLIEIFEKKIKDRIGEIWGE